MIREKEKIRKELEATAGNTEEDCVGKTDVILVQKKIGNHNRKSTSVAIK